MSIPNEEKATGSEPDAFPAYINAKIIEKNNPFTQKSSEHIENFTVERAKDRCVIIENAVDAGDLVGYAIHKVHHEVIL